LKTYTYSAEKLLTLTWDGITCDAGRMNVTGSKPTTVSIYPNPAVDNFTVELNSSEAGSMTMNIYNMNGSLVSSKDLKLTQGNNVINENISSLSSGIYFVNFYNSASNETIVKKLVKN
jgi:Secretion system C-terminal sorting domain